MSNKKAACKNIHTMQNTQNRVAIRRRKKSLTHRDKAAEKNYL